MICAKCEKEVSENSMFCSNCGSKVEERSLNVQLDDAMKTCAQLWYILGYMRGMNKKNKKSLEEFEELLKNKFPALWEKYQDIVKLWEDWAISDDEELKEKVRLKRASISEVKGVQKKK